MKKKYDIIVVGAGPAGSTFARLAANAGLSVLLLDKKKKIGTPVRCGEAVAARDLHSITNPKNIWIKNKIDTFGFVPPNRDIITIHLNQTGYILDRTIFDYDLAMLAKEQGADLVNQAYVNELIIKDDYVCGVKGVRRNNKFSIRSKIVIAADGVEGRIARFAGIKSRIILKDLDPGYEKSLSDISVEPSTCYFYLSNELAPGGYIWVFPKNAHEANIGIGIAGNKYEKNNSAKTRLNKFIDMHYPTHTVDSITMGGVILAKPIKEMVGNGIMLIGDAARTVDPLSGGGIIWSMRSAMYAADVAIQALKDSKGIDKNILREYQDIWLRNEGKQIKRLYRFKEAIYNLTDSELNKIASSINNLPEDKRTFVNLFKISFKNKPSLLLDIAKQFIRI